MNFDKKKIVICFFVILIFFNNLGFKNVKANPAVIPIAGQAFVEFLITVAGCLGVQYLTYPDAEDFTNDILNSASVEDLEILGIEKDDDGNFYLNEDKTLEIEFTDEGISVPTDWLKEYTRFFKETLNDKLNNNDLKLNYDYSSDLSLLNLLKDLDLPALNCLDRQPKPTNCNFDNSLSEFINSDNFVYLTGCNGSYVLNVASYSSNNVVLITNYDKICFPVNGYYFTYVGNSGYSIWQHSTWGQSSGFYVYDGDAILNNLLWTNKNIVDTTGSKVKDSDLKDTVDSFVYDNKTFDLSELDNIFDIDLDEFSNIVDEKAKEGIDDSVIVPIPDIADVGSITYDPIFDKPISERLTVDIPIDVPVDDIFGGEEIEDDVYTDSNIFDWFSNFWDNLLKFVKSLFIVDDLYFVEKIDCYKQKLTDILNLDFSFFDTFNDLSDGDFKDIRININGNNVVIVDFSNLNKFRGYFKALISGVVEIFFWFFNYRQLVWLIRKSTVFGGSSERNEKR